MQRISSGQRHATYRLGDLAVVSLCDGYADMATSRLRQPGDKPFGDDLPAQVRLVDGALRLSVNTFAIDDGADITLIDVGAANAWHPTTGFLPEALQEAKIDVDRIRTVAVTHTHLDHIHGLVLADGNDGFTQLSRLLVPRLEMAMFRAEARLQRFHDRAEPLDVGQRLNAQIEAIDARGHEVGHTCFRVTSGGETLLIWGDVVHVPSLQFDRPEITWEFDADQDAARATRLRLLALAADNNCYVAGAHLDAPGVGRVVRNGEGFRFEAV
ncbi:MBL fold metallo-hydrolase [Roseiterribacter gracilis]|uniref:MBL fold metallo-hydrolase n=1 Tax=Roseiterribacter gracilis TaxID=2812848 RepID=A0A8S8XEL1_9PROT|nr:MBL fold metallo-hydrolase [Rhodospirillales bacterium TMPK1]